MNRLVSSPDEAAGEEREQQHHAVVPLCLAAGHVDFVQEPVDVQEGAGEFIEDEGGGVEVNERSLEDS